MNDNKNSSKIIQKNEKHENAYFAHTEKKSKYNKERMQYLKEKEKLEQEIEEKLNKIEKKEFIKLKNENKGKVLDALNKRDIEKNKKLEKTTVIPTISLEDSENNRKQKNKEKKLNILKKISNYFKKLEEQRKLKLEKKQNEKNNVTVIKEKDKKNVTKEKDLEIERKKELRRQAQQKKEEEKKKFLEIKIKKRKEKEEQRKGIIKKNLEEKARRQKEKEDKMILLQSEKKAQLDKIKREKEEAKKQRKEKLELIRKAQEESREKQRSERKTLEEKLVDWYNNLSFVRDAKNRRELQRQTLLIDFEGADAVRSEEKIMYKYVAKNNETGKVETGFFAAFSKLDVHSFLIAEGYEVYEIKPQKNFAKSFVLVTPKFKSNELDFFLTQLSTFLKSGITLIESVKILSKQCKKKSQKNVYKSIIYELSMGENFSEALSKQGNIFPRLLINMVKTSELTGDLPVTLDDMADYYREIEKTRKQMISAITYPLVVLIFAITILIFIMVKVIPQFVDIYKDLGTNLPKITVIIINLSAFLQKNWIFLILGIIGVVIIFAILFKTIKVFKTVIQSFIMNVPVFGKIVIYNEVTMFTKTFASLLNHNVYITDCMEVLSKITNNEIYKMLIFDTIKNLAKGDAISNSFKNHWAFPTIAYEMILTGEKTGQLGNMMDKVANYYQELHKNAVNQIKAFIEPVMIVVLALIVGIVLLSVILPMFDMYQNIG